MEGNKTIIFLVVFIASIGYSKAQQSVLVYPGGDWKLVSSRYNIAGSDTEVDLSIYD